MKSFDHDDCLLNDELISVSLDLFEVKFIFFKNTIAVSGEFWLQNSQGARYKFLPQVHFGDARCLWDLIGRKIVQISLNTSFDIHFDAGETVSISPALEGGRGTISSVITVAGEERQLFEEF